MQKMWYAFLPVPTMDGAEASCFGSVDGLIALRKRLPVVRDGSYQEYYKGSDKLYVYARETKEQKLLVICSFTDKPVRFQAPYNFSLSDMKLLLTNYDDTREENSFVTRPYEARVYLYE